MAADKKILITTSYIDGNNGHYDWVGSNIKWKYRFSRPRKVSYALRFIKQNLPEIEILEYPTWDEYQRALNREWDIVGFSFYLNEVHKVKRMIEYARDKDIPELWGGNYGVLTDGMDKLLDRVFVGYAEHEIARYLKKKLPEIIHPPIINTLEFGSLNIMRFGVLFTSRGCTHSCKFCQTPSFQPTSDVINLETLENVVKYYRAVGINIIGIFDENFGLHRKHSGEVVKILNKYKMYWACMARAEYVAKQAKTWTANGGRFIGAGVGIESLNSDILAEMNKKFDEKKIVADLKTIKNYNIGIMGYYIIGFENETEESIKLDLKKLFALKNDINQITIVTPLPKTQLWDDLDTNYGIFEKDYTKFDTKHLVWRHPRISKERLELLLDRGLRTANPRQGFIKMAYRFHKLLHNNDGFKAYSTFPKNMYNTKKFDTKGYKIFFDRENGGMVRYKFDFDGKEN
ncbi:B12-binding domain-containing radical SAM protein [[Eubacterium] cellulosolvens]